MPNCTKLLLITVLTAACSSSKETAKPAEQPLTCDDRVKVSGVCPGAPSADVCSGSACTDGVTCTSTVNVSTGADLAAKASSSPPDTCIVLAPGQYSESIKLAPGVSVLGRRARDTTIAGVRVDAARGGTAWIRGVTIGSGGLYTEGAGALNVDQVVVKGGASYGIFAVDTNLSITASTIEGGTGFGVLARCTKDPCDPMARPNVKLRLLDVHDVETVGVWMRGVSASFEGVGVTKVRQSSKTSEFGRGVEIAGGAAVNATAVLVEKNADVGVLVDRSSATLKNIRVSENDRGVQLQATPETPSTELDDFDIRDNVAVGLGFHNAAAGLIIQGGLVASTKEKTVLVGAGGSEKRSDAINWLGASKAVIKSSVTLSGSSRAHAVIEDSATGSFDAKVIDAPDKPGVGLIIQGGKEPAATTPINFAADLKPKLDDRHSKPVGVEPAMKSSAGI